ncbi:hypothetical protein [Agromyces sp. NDB4Y10]|uniref:hypothetical protein n=1 Tax=Agromyces sp. NDB4Y10 TaxID=1775951 RepID=UPI000A3E765A
MTTRVASWTARPSALPAVDIQLDRNQDATATAIFNRPSTPRRDPPARATRWPAPPRFEQWTDRLVAAAGIPDPVPAARALMALGDGLVLHRLTIDPELDVCPAVERAVRALAATR